MVHSRAQTRMRPPDNKEAEWSGICEDVFVSYGLHEDVFFQHPHQRESSISDQSSNLFDYPVSSAQSNRTNGTSPDPAWMEHVTLVQAQCDDIGAYLSQQQPQAKQGQMQWEKAIDQLEHAAELNTRTHALRSSQSHPEFLSIGGNPSPPAPYVPCPVPDHSLSIPRTRPHDTANGKKRSTSQLRSVSRGRPQAVAKNISNTGNNLTMSGVRKRSNSPTKMMTPSRYRAGVQDAWADKLQATPTKYALRVPTHALPESPPASGQLLQQDFAAFGSPTSTAPVAMLASAYDPEVSPLTSNFQHARIHTPDASPFFTGAGQQSYLDAHAVYPATTYASQAMSLQGSAMTTNRIGSFDFGFNTAATADTWSSNAYQTTMPEYNAAVMAQNAYAGVEHSIVPHQLGYGLGISCDTATLYNPSTNTYDNLMSAVPIPPASRSVAYPPVMSTEPVPITPQKQKAQRSSTPSPPLTEPRSRRASASNGIRRASKHRRTKSTTSVPRQTQGDKGGFVNFTPDDSGKILSGVAPSGSSKTKARREKEAADRRRKLSMAAVKAVQDAGGDVGALTSTGLIETL